MSRAVGGKKNKTQKKKKQPSGITENYARELLELHTLGVHGGYTQKDVIEVARILTGWTVQDLQRRSYAFAFKPDMHDFGRKVVLGVAYALFGTSRQLIVGMIRIP